MGFREKWRAWKYRSLLRTTKENTEKFSLDGTRVIAKCVDVYDGDSITVVFKFNGKFQQFSIRMAGYDTPEVRTKNELEKEYGLRAKQALSDKVLDKLIWINCGEFDKYGRLLGTITTMDGLNINNFMTANRYGYPYDGGTKKKFDDLKDWYNDGWSTPAHSLREIH